MGFMRCSNCGTEQSDRARFCADCGASIAGSETQAVSTTGQLHQSHGSPPWKSPQVQQSPLGPPRTYGTDYDTLRRISAEQKSFTTPAIITLILYLVLWIPGLIANLIDLNEANNIQSITGKAP